MGQLEALSTIDSCTHHPDFFFLCTELSCEPLETNPKPDMQLYLFIYLFSEASFIMVMLMCWNTKMFSQYIYKQNESIIGVGLCIVSEASVRSTARCLHGSTYIQTSEQTEVFFYSFFCLCFSFSLKSCRAWVIDSIEVRPQYLIPSAPFFFWESI